MHVLHMSLTDLPLSNFLSFLIQLWLEVSTKMQADMLLTYLIPI